MLFRLEVTFHHVLEDIGLSWDPLSIWSSGPPHGSVESRTEAKNDGADAATFEESEIAHDNLSQHDPDDAVSLVGLSWRFRLHRSYELVIAFVVVFEVNHVAVD